MILIRQVTEITNKTVKLNDGRVFNKSLGLEKDELVFVIEENTNLKYKYQRYIFGKFTYQPLPDRTAVRTVEDAIIPVKQLYPVGVYKKDSFDKIEFNVNEDDDYSYLFGVVEQEKSESLQKEVKKPSIKKKEKQKNKDLDHKLKESLDILLKDSSDILNEVHDENDMEFTGD